MPNPFNGQWIDLFKAGDYGDKGKFSVEDLNHIANGYDPNFSAAPLVKGHPKTDDEAHGWVQGMRVVGDTLQGLFQDVKDETAKLMKSGAFKNRSVAIYDDLKGKGMYLRHVGLLGAVPPEVRALEPIKFEDGEAKFAAVDFKDDKPIEEKTKADDDVKTVGGKDGITKVEVTTMFQKFAANLTEGMNKILGKKSNGNGNTRVVGGEAKMADTQKQIDDALAKERRLNSAKNFVEKMKASKKWIPAFTEAGFEQLLEGLANSEISVTFGETGKEKEASAFDMVSALLESIPELVPTKGLPSVGKKLKSGAAKFAEPDPRGAQFDDDSLVVAEKMEEEFAEIKKANPKMSDQEARREAYRRAQTAFEATGGGAGQQSPGVA